MAIITNYLWISTPRIGPKSHYRNPDVLMWCYLKEHYSTFLKDSTHLVSLESIIQYESTFRKDINTLLSQVLDVSHRHGCSYRCTHAKSQEYEYYK